MYAGIINLLKSYHDFFVQNMGIGCFLCSNIFTKCRHFRYRQYFFHIVYISKVSYMKKTSVGLVKIRKKYRFEFFVLNIKEISYTKIRLINTDFDAFLTISDIFHGKIMNNHSLDFYGAHGAY